MDMPNKRITDAYASIVERKSFKPLTEASLQHILGKKHSGYFIISACRSDWVEYELKRLGFKSEKEFMDKFGRTKLEMLTQHYWNALRSKELEKDLRKLGFGYIPVYGGFRETSSANPEGVVVLERSFFVPFVRSTGSFDDARSKITELGAKYRQESVTVCPPGEAPYFHVCTEYPNGDAVGTEQRYFGKEYSVNDVAKEFFTSLNSQNRNTDGEFDKKQPRRFSFEPSDESVMIGGEPMSYQEAYSRNMRGEIFAPPYPSAKMAKI